LLLENKPENLPPLKVVAFLDMRPGHRKQTQGIVNALSRLTPVELFPVNMGEPAPGSSVGQAFGYFGAALGLPGGVKTGKGVHPPLPEKPDIIIGAGSRTHFPMLTLRRRRGGRAVTCMTPNWPLGSLMDLCCVPAHDEPPAKGNIFVTLGPPNTASSLGSHDNGKGLIAVGGVDEKTHDWEPRHITGCVEAILKKMPGVFWSITTSPRTPPSMEPLLAGLSGHFENAAFFPFRKTAPGWVEERYAESGYAWVTADSVSMVYEALSAGCLTGIIPVQWKKPDSRLARSIFLVENKGLALNYSKWEKNPLAWPQATKLDEAWRCAREILRRFFPERLEGA
jgi:hypothetical protein